MKRRFSLLLYLLISLLTIAVIGCQSQTETKSGASSSSSAAQPKEKEKVIEWKILSSWGPDNPAVYTYVIPLVEELNKKANGRLKVSWKGPEAVPAFEQLAALKSGVFDALYTNGAYHAGEVPTAQVMDTVVARSKEIRESGLFDGVNEAYENKAGVKLLSVTPMGSGYNLLLRDRKIDKADLSGLKIRGMPIYKPLLERLGGAYVGGIPVPEIYTSIEKGVLDGAMFMAIGLIDSKLYEVTKYALRPRFGESVQIYLANSNSWKGMPDDLKELIVETMKGREEAGRDALMEQLKREEGQLSERGMEFISLPPQEADKFLDAFYNGTWEELLKQDPQYGRKLKEITDKLLHKW